MLLNKKIVNEDKNSNTNSKQKELNNKDTNEVNLNKEIKEIKENSIEIQEDKDINKIDKVIVDNNLKDNEKLLKQDNNHKNNGSNNENKTMTQYFNLRPESKELLEQESRILDSYKYISPSTNSVLQNPFKQLYNFYNNYSICPFCKYVGKMKIEYITSNTQKKCCFTLALTGIALICSWIPFMINDCADQVYKCPSCNKELEIIKSNQFI